MPERSPQEGTEAEFGKQYQGQGHNPHAEARAALRRSSAPPHRDPSARYDGGKHEKHLKYFADHSPERWDDQALPNHSPGEPGDHNQKEIDESGEEDPLAM